MRAGKISQSARIEKQVFKELASMVKRHSLSIKTLEGYSLDKHESFDKKLMSYVMYRMEKTGSHYGESSR